MDQLSDEAPSALPAVWRFAHVRYDEAQAQLWVDGRETFLERNGAALLSHFVRHAGQVVHKDVLLEVGWAGRIVAENTLAKAVGRLRLAIGDQDGQLLRVAHGYGYLLAAHVQRDDGAIHPTPDPPVTLSRPEPEAPLRREPVPLGRLPILDALVILGTVTLGLFAFTASPPAIHAIAMSSEYAESAPSIAVLPFADLSKNRDQQYFADGLAEELLDSLTRLDRLRVAARTSSFALRDKSLGIPAVGRELGVRYVLEGSVRSAADRVRVTAQLIDAANGFHLWSETYERPLDELFSLQDEIVGRIVESLRVKLDLHELRAATRHGTSNGEAFRHYLYAKSIVKDAETDGRRSVVALRRAVAIDPNFFDAWLALALQLSYDSVYPDSRDEVQANKREAFEIIERLIAQRPEQADLYLYRGDMTFWHRWDFASAERDFTRAVELGMRRDDAVALKMGRLYAATGRLDQALSATAAALAHRPTSDVWVVRAYHLLAMRRFEEAASAARQALQLHPTDAHAHYYLGLSELLQGRLALAQGHFDDSSSTFRLAGAAMAAYSQGDYAASEQNLHWLSVRYGHVAPYLVAEVHAWRGEHDQAFVWMQRSVEIRDGSLLYLAFDPLIATLRGDPRWGHLLQQVKLDGYVQPTRTLLGAPIRQASSI